MAGVAVSFIAERLSHGAALLCVMVRSGPRKRVFQAFDRDHNGTLDLQEFRSALRKLDLNVSDQVFQVSLFSDSTGIAMGKYAWRNSARHVKRCAQMFLEKQKNEYSLRWRCFFSWYGL